MVARAHDIGEREQRAHRVVRVAGAGDRDEGGAGERDAHRFPLPSVDPVVSERASGHALRRHSSAAMRAHAVAVRERGDDEVTLGDAAHLRPDLLHHADELVADRPQLVGGLPAVVPQVRAADTPQHDAHDGVGRRGHHRVGPFRDLDTAGPFKDCSTHGFHLLDATQPRVPLRGLGSYCVTLSSRSTASSLVRPVRTLHLEHPTDLDLAFGAVLAGVDLGKRLERETLGPVDGLVH